MWRRRNAPRPRENRGVANIPRTAVQQRRKRRRIWALQARSIGRGHHAARAACSRIDSEENLAILPQLGLADAVHGAHLGGSARLAPGHVDQGLVGEHHIGGDALLLGKLGPAPPQRLEQRRVAAPAVGERRGVGGGARRLARRRLERVLAQRDLVGALEHAPAGFGDRPGAVAGDVERDDAGAVQLAEDRAPFLLAVFLADAEGRQAIVAEFHDRLGVLADAARWSDARCRSARRCARWRRAPSAPRSCRRSPRRRRSRNRNCRRAAPSRRNRRAASAAGSAAIRTARPAR